MRINGTRTDPIRLYDTVDLIHETGRILYDGNVIVDPSARQLSPRASQLRLKCVDSRGPGARTSASGRRGPIACWHAYRDMIRAVLTAHPDATIRTGLALYKGLSGFEETYPETAYINMGGPMHQTYMPDLCECGDTPPFILTLPGQPAGAPVLPPVRRPASVGAQFFLNPGPSRPAFADTPPEIKVDDTVTHPAGWTGTVKKIEGMSYGNRILTVEEFDGYTSDWLEHIFTDAGGKNE